MTPNNQKPFAAKCQTIWYQSSRQMPGQMQTRNMQVTLLLLIVCWKLTLNGRGNSWAMVRQYLTTLEESGLN